MAFGIGLLVSRTGFLFLTIGLTIFFLRLIGLEEAKLEREQGERYREYCRWVPRIWPSLKPRLPSGGVTPQWGQAFLGEIHMWGFLVGMTAFAITLNQRVAWWIVGTAVVLYAVRSYVVSARRNRAPLR
jgi:hypothetical protein